eukprot:8650726-Pyramimonas_sp.AAC.1
MSSMLTRVWKHSEQAGSHTSGKIESEETLLKGERNNLGQKRGCMLLAFKGLNNMLGTEQLRNDPPGEHSITSDSEDGEERRPAPPTPQSNLTSHKFAGVNW